MHQLIHLVNQTDKGLAALLRGLVFRRVEEGQITFVWPGQFHVDRMRGRDLQPYLGPHHATHITLDEARIIDPMLDEALRLGAKINKRGGNL